MPSGPANRLLPALRRVVLGRPEASRTDGQLLGAFVTDRDPEAFAGLVRRHGPMVLGVCRRVVGDAHAAEDSFQAVFIVLARRAAAVRPREQVGNWLYGVAYRTALKARAVLARRRSREKQVGAMPEPAAKPPPDVWADLQPVIDEELNRLPDKLRVPVVLCDLEGRPQRQVAAQLKVPPATLATRLAAARRVLAARLTKRGVALSGGALAAVLGERASAAVVPPLTHAVVQTAEAVALGVPPASPLVSAHAVQLSEGVMRMMLVAKLKAVCVTAVSVLAVTGGLGLGLMPAQAGDDPAVRVIAVKQPDAKAQPAPKPMNDAEFLNRLCLDLRGTPATLLERVLFAGDSDPNKRAKVVEWFLTDEAVKPFLAKKFDVTPDAIQSVKAADVGDGMPTVIVSLAPHAAKVKAVAFSPDGKRVAIEQDVPLKLNVTVAPDPEVKTFLFLEGGAPRVVNEAYDGVWDLVVKQPDPALPAARVWDVATGKQVRGTTWRAKAVGVDDLIIPQDAEVVWSLVDADESDAAFLRRAVTSARGSPPTAIEEKYFAEDKDPKKREKLLDALLKDPAVQKKVGDDWKKQMLSANSERTYTGTLDSYYRTLQPRPTYERVYTAKVKLIDPADERLGKLIDALLGAKKPDEQVLDAVALTVLGRLPTESEKSLTLAGVAKAPDRRAAWLGVAKALGNTDEAKKHADALKGSAKP